MKWIGAVVVIAVVLYFGIRGSLERRASDRVAAATALFEAQKYEEVVEAADAFAESFAWTEAADDMEALLGKAREQLRLRQSVRRDLQVGAGNETRYGPIPTPRYHLPQPTHPPDSLILSSPRRALPGRTPGPG